MAILNIESLKIILERLSFAYLMVCEGRFVRDADPKGVIFLHVETSLFPSTSLKSWVIIVYTKKNYT